MTDPTYVPASWRVDSQAQRDMITANNNIVSGYDIAFTTGEGHSGTVFVPTSKYTPANVKAAVQALADQLDAVGSLTHESEV